MPDDSLRGTCDKEILEGSRCRWESSAKDSSAARLRRYRSDPRSVDSLCEFAAAARSCYRRRSGGNGRRSWIRDRRQRRSTANRQRGIADCRRDDGCVRIRRRLLVADPRHDRDADAGSDIHAIADGHAVSHSLPWPITDTISDTIADAVADPVTCAHGIPNPHAGPSPVTWLLRQSDVLTG
jgi:hypothetical protein